MVPSPRKRATRASFNQTWDDSDAASFDPSSLPVARIPRGWERKQETKRTEQGREKKIWRRVGLRSRASNTADEEDEEEHDARSRAVKKQQHMSPKAMEKTASRLNGKKRTFKATRYDRRKSVLPRKKQSRPDNSLLEEQEDEESDQEQDATGEELSFATPVDVHPAPESKTESAPILPEQEDRRSTFTFSVYPQETEELSERDVLVEPVDGPQEELELDAPMEDATITRLFRSPVNDYSPPSEDTSQPLQYPELPYSDSDDIETDVPILTYVQGQYVEVQVQGETEIEEQESHTDAEGGEPVLIENAPLASPEEHEMASIDTDVEDVSNVGLTLETTSANIASTEQLTPSDVAYPALPVEPFQDDALHHPAASPKASHEEIVESGVPSSNVVQDTFTTESSSEDIDMEDELAGDNVPDMTADENLTEASLQLDILRNDETEQSKGYATDSFTPVHASTAAEAEQDDETKPTEELSIIETSSGDNDQPADDQYMPLDIHTAQGEDITDGLTLSFTPAKATSCDPTPRKLHSPPPPPPTQSNYDDVTMTIALDDDTALLKDFLTRAAASKAEKAAVVTHRRESLQNRRDSDVIRHALASPRKVLEDKDPNSPSKYDNELTLDLSQNLTLTMDPNALASPSINEADDGSVDDKALRGSRRSSRTKKSRLPAPASAVPQPAQTSKIAIRRADGTEHVVLKKSDAQELSLLTRANTRKNKQGAFGVTVRLLKLAADAANLAPVDDSTRELVVGKNIRWDKQLTYYQENPETVAERASLATPDELSMPDAPSSTTLKPKSKVPSTSTPKMRRVRGLGTANGTPGKALLAPPSFPDSFDEDKEKESASQQTQSITQQLPRPRSLKLKKMTVASTTSTPTPSVMDSRLPALEVMPVGIETPKERKSRLAAPKKVVLPPSAVAVDGKENATTQRPGLSTATPKKGIPAPKVVVPHGVGNGAGVESGLPRRRGRRV
ncbi:hypothetical protein DE146DRAFT_40080 [Phaeosphaeria sp. MPI-PUGE-AT-0046c]|nr:hypothetical protein DE146DRAFT_40080 [Phaeosphaeria sp. MPI-PUGE-AT-0046c]